MLSGVVSSDCPLMTHDNLQIQAPRCSADTQGLAVMLFCVGPLSAAGMIAGPCREHVPTSFILLAALDAGIACSSLPADHSRPFGIQAKVRNKHGELGWATRLDRSSVKRDQYAQDSYFATLYQRKGTLHALCTLHALNPAQRCL